MTESENVKVIWDGLRKFGIATGPGVAVFFLPGLNTIPKDVWIGLTKDPTCAVNIHLKGGLLRLASDDAQQGDDIGRMGIPAAVEIVGEVMDEAALAKVRAQEMGRPGGPREDVLVALAGREELFSMLAGGEDETGESGAPSSEKEPEKPKRRRGGKKK